MMISPIEGYLGKWLELADTEGLKPIVRNFDLERSVALQLRFIDKETGKPVLGEVHYCPCYDNPRYEEARTSPERRVYQYYKPHQKGVFSFVVVPGPSIIGFMAGVNGEKKTNPPPPPPPHGHERHALLHKHPPLPRRGRRHAKLPRVSLLCSPPA